MGTKRNKKAIIITGVLMLLGLLLTLTGFFGDRILGLFQKDLDYKNLSAEDIGSDIRSDFFVYYEPISIKDKTLQVVGDMEGEYGFILLDLSKLSAKDKDLYFMKASQHITISGKIRGVDDAEFQTVLESLYKLYDHYFYDRRWHPYITAGSTDTISKASFLSSWSYSRRHRPLQHGSVPSYKDRIN